MKRALLLWLIACCSAQPVAAQGSRLLATSGVTQVEGSAGGGIVPWALISGYGSDTEFGAAGFLTRVSVDDFDLRSAGLAVGFGNRLELSAARQHLDVTALNLDIEQDVFGLKYRLGGDAVYDRMPQLAIGLQHKRNRDFDIPRLLGADQRSGTDVYLSATKLLLGAVAGRNLLLNATLRRSEANQGGLLGFGSVGGSDPELLAEWSAAVFVNRHWAIGYEYREKPDALAVREQDWSDAFLAWFPDKRLAFVLAHADLGDIAGFRGQSGWYLSVQLSH